MNQTYKLPPRKWYTLEQAIKRIKQLTGEELEIADLIHYCMNHQIEIYTSIESDLENLVIGNIEIKDELLHYFTIDTFIHGDEDIKTSVGNSFSYTTIVDSLKAIEITNEIYNNVTDDFMNQFEKNLNKTIKKRDVSVIKGLISIYINDFGIFNSISPINIERFFSKNGMPLNNISSLVSPPVKELFQLMDSDNPPKAEQRIYFRLKVDDEIENCISLDNLFILNDDLEDFLNGKSKAEEIKQKLNQAQTQLPRPKTLNAQAEFIRNLLIMFYDETTANNIRKELDNPNSEIRQDFERKGLPTPSGKTVDRWINQP